MEDLKEQLQHVDLELKQEKEIVLTLTEKNAVSMNN